MILYTNGLPVNSPCGSGTHNFDQHENKNKRLPVCHHSLINGRQSLGARIYGIYFWPNVLFCTEPHMACEMQILISSTRSKGRAKAIAASRLSQDHF